MMALSERSRSALYQGFSALVDEEAIQEMLSFFPARDVEEPVTKEFLRAELAEMEVRLGATFRAEMKSEIKKSVLINAGMLVALAGLLITVMRP